MDSKQLSFASLGLDGAAVTDATIQANILAVTSHADNVFELHTILLDGPTLEARHLNRETFEGEVTCLGLCSIGGKAHAVASLWWNSAIYLDLYSIQDKEHVKTIPIQSRKYTISSLNTKYGRKGQGAEVAEKIHAAPFDFFLCLVPTLIFLESFTSTAHGFLLQHETTLSSIVLEIPVLL